MFGIGANELILILLFGFLIFGPDKLPEIAKTVGKGIARFREAQQEMNDVLGDEKIIDLNNPDEPFKDPVEALDRIAQRQEEKRAAAKGDKPASPADGEQASDASEGEPKQESFTERKARYERERAARKAAEAEAAKAAEEAAAEAAKPSDEATAAVSEDAPSSDVAQGGDA